MGRQIIGSGIGLSSMVTHRGPDIVTRAMTETAPNPLKRFSLSQVFLFACLAVMGSAMLIVGFWVSRRIESAVVQNSANAAALYMESFISPLSQELAGSDRLSGPAEQAMIEIFRSTPLGERVVSYKIWKTGGLVVHASDPDVVGRRFDPTDDLRAAWQGRISAAFEDLDDDESHAEASLGVPLLEVYSPIRELWSGEIIAVAEFYEHADALREELADARRTSWLVVASTFAASALALYGIVAVGDRIIRAQAGLLGTRLEESQRMARQNADLRKRVVDASARATAQSDRFLRRLGADLHDGPAQYLALASLRLDSVLSAAGVRSGEATEIRASLDSALGEIRALSRGLALPDLDDLTPEQAVFRAVKDHGAHGRQHPEVTCEGDHAPPLGYSENLCIFRFVQETLSNAARHAPEARCRVTCRTGPETFAVAVSDDGPGFEPETAMRLRVDGGQGLMGLRDRVESLGGRFEIITRPGRGTSVELSLSLRPTDRT